MGIKLQPSWTVILVNTWVLTKSYPPEGGAAKDGNYNAEKNSSVNEHLDLKSSVNDNLDKKSQKSGNEDIEMAVINPRVDTPSSDTSFEKHRFTDEKPKGRLIFIPLSAFIFILIICSHEIYRQFITTD